MNEIRTKGLDEKFCPECGSVIKSKAEICVHCGARQNGVNQVDSISIGNNILNNSVKTPKIFGIINIIFGSFILIKYVVTNRLVFELKYLYWTSLNIPIYEFIDFYPIVILSIILFLVYAGIIISGIGLLKYKKWGRLIAIFLAPIIILISILSNQNLFKYNAIAIDVTTFLLIMFELLSILLSMSYLFVFNQKAFRDSLK